MVDKTHGSGPPEGSQTIAGQGPRHSKSERKSQTKRRSLRRRSPRKTRSPDTQDLSPVIRRNIRSLQQRQEERDANATGQERLVQAITSFTGSMPFVYLHVFLFGFWIIANLVVIPGAPQWDPSFVVLAMVASVEAIFLSTFVLITQNRMAAAAQERAELDLQINLLTEHEVTKLVALVSAMAEKMGAQTAADPEIGELKQEVAPEAVLDEIEASG